MATLTIVYWRNIPAQVIVKAGRRSAKRQLSERFEQGIDRAAMKTGAAGTDDYLADWRRETVGEIDADDLEAAAQAEADRLEARYDREALKALIEAGGREG